MHVSIFLFLGLLVAIAPSFAQDSSLGLDDSEIWSYHFQFTGIAQYHGSFAAPYSGNNSLKNTPESPLSVTATLFLGRRLWEGGEAYLNPEMSGGGGFSSTQGVAGFPNGEVYRVDATTPRVTVARAFVRQHFPIGNSDTEKVAPDQNQLGGRLPGSRLTVTAGRFSLTDIFGDNRYSHDPRTQTMNWAIWAPGAWDYAADTRGYTWGFAAEFRKPQWTINFAAVMVPTSANGSDFDPHIGEAFSLNFELMKPYALAGREGKVRVLAFWNHAHMGNYSQAIAEASTTGHSPDITTTRSYCSKFGFALDFEQVISKTIGTFARFSWNDGKTETWAFTEIDRSFQLGVNIEGDCWNRAEDNLGAAVAVNALSQSHRDYLALGGYGFIIGDGRLNYGLEQIVEFYYSARLFPSFWITLDNQLIINPAYNKDRGPVVDAIAIRGHVEF